MPKRATTPYGEYEQAVSAYTKVGGQETLQRVVTAISRLGRRLDVFYREQFEELNVSHGEWTVLSTLAVGGRLDPVQAGRHLRRLALDDDPPARPDGGPRTGRPLP